MLVDQLTSQAVKKIKDNCRHRNQELEVYVLVHFNHFSIAYTLNLLQQGCEELDEMSRQSAFVFRSTI